MSVTIGTPLAFRLPAVRISRPFDICPASITLGFPTSYDFLIRNMVWFFYQCTRCIALGIPSAFAFLPRNINRPFKKCPIRTTISFTIASISLDIVYVGGGEYSSGSSLILPDKVLHSNSHLTHKMPCAQGAMTILWVIVAENIKSK